MTREIVVWACAVGLLVAALGVRPSNATAQEPGGEEETVGDEFGTPSQAGFADPDDDHELWHVDNRIKAGRITLITSAVALPVGGLVFMGGTLACVDFDLFAGSCPRGATAAMGLGGALFLMGAVGVITGAVLLGVSKKRKRELSQALLKIRWDARTARFVF